MKRLLTLAALCVSLSCRLAMAGHETPCFIDGCQSMDGRWTITASPVGKITNHGPNRWQFHLKDNQSQEVRTVDAQGVQGGQIHAQLLLPPGGKTFALFNHVTLWSSGKSDMHGVKELIKDRTDPNWRTQPSFSNRLIIYRNDGSILKAFNVADLVTEAEWAEVNSVFNRVHWIRDYPDLSYRKTPRPAYAFFQVSPDYSVIEFLIVPPRASKDKTGRRVRVSLTDGRIIPAEEKLSPEQTPGRAFVGDAVAPEGLSADEKDNFQPSLDPARKPGAFAPLAPTAGVSPKDTTKDKVPSPLPAKLELVREGLKKADTPAWLPAERCLVLTDLDAKKLYRLDDAAKPLAELRDESVRAKTGPDGRLYGVFGGRFCSYKPGEGPRVIAEKAAGGREFQVNDIAVSKTHAYVTTLKDPEKGRLSVVDLKTGTVTVAFDGEMEGDLLNPNGVALSPDGTMLYVGISNYKNKGKSGVYRFALRADGSVDVTTGKATRWAAVQGPDGIAVMADGTVCFTAGGEVLAFSADGRKVGSVKVPKGSGTNLCFGGEDGKTLYVTTNNALYMGK